MLGDIREHAWLNDLTARLILAVVVTISCATYHYVELSAQGGKRLLRHRMAVPTG
ncbi:hypothetical protein [Pseudomonas sp. W2-17]|uniref:hypothetical protein n=1 Tax=Pseudomonas sp. W2-17 TaxID=3058039 RepID=UPI0034E093D1